MKNKISLNLQLVMIVFILALLFVFNYVAISFRGTITLAICGNGIDYSSEEYQAAKAKAMDLAVDIEEEAAVLLKNENNILPLQDRKVNVFGWGASDKGFMWQGGGSGHGSSVGRTEFYMALRYQGFTLNEDLCDAYNAVSYTRPGDVSGNWPGLYAKYEVPKSFYTDELIAQAKSFSDTALVMLTRFGAESNDIPLHPYNLDGSIDTSVKYLELWPEEKDMLDIVTSNFTNVIVLLNNGNTMELGFLDDEKIDAAIEMYFPGNNAAEAVGKILKGEVNPSGHLVDTVAYDVTTSASFINAGGHGSGYYQENGARVQSFADYAEGIYIGYYWYETADKEGFWDSDFAKQKWGIEKGYEDVVQYPFGYGLSYADFAWSLGDCSFADGDLIDDPEAEISVKVFVENTLGLAGRDVVELYLTAPYTKGGIEKPAVRLVAYAKTNPLSAGGDGQLVELTFKLRDIASYDCYDANNNGFMGYELEEGTYTLSLRTDAHTVKEVDGGSELTFRIPEKGFRYETDGATGHKVGNLFTTYTNPTSGASSKATDPTLPAHTIYSVDGSDAGQNITYMTRADFTGTFPAACRFTGTDLPIPENSYRVLAPSVNSDDTMPAVGAQSDVMFEDLIGEEYDDPRWLELVQKLSLNELTSLVRCGITSPDLREQIGLPRLDNGDGPAGWNTSSTTGDGGHATNYPCATALASTWNWWLAYQFGLSVAEEGEALNLDGWYGPACNTHRNPYSGRNFEYYSEDPLIGGTVAAYSVLGAKENGLISFLKHFVAYESDTLREGKYVWMSEQTLREIYLKPFEMGVKVGGTIGIMTSYNRIGSVRTSGSYVLNTQVLRDEWGFEGCVISDYYFGGNTSDVDECIRAGNDWILYPDNPESNFDDTKSATAIIALQKSAKNIIFAYAEALHTQATAQGLDLDAVIGTKTDIYPWWLWILGGIDALAVGGCIAWGVIAIKKSRRS